METNCAMYHGCSKEQVSLLHLWLWWPSVVETLRAKVGGRILIDVLPDEHESSPSTVTDGTFLTPDDIAQVACLIHLSAGG